MLDELSGSEVEAVLDFEESQKGFMGRNQYYLKKFIEVKFIYERKIYRVDGALNVTTETITAVTLQTVSFVNVKN